MLPDEYLSKMTEQIRYRKIRPQIRDEFEKHILDQQEQFMKDGMHRQEALRMAIIEMGDPVSVGAQLDRIHRPKMDWRMLGLVGILSVLGLIVQQLLEDGGKVNGAHVWMAGMDGQRLLLVAVGFGLMFLLGAVDYSFLSKRGWLLYGIFSGLTGLYHLFGASVNGQLGAAVLWMYLYIPLYAGVLSQCQKRAGRMQMFLAAAAIAVPWLLEELGPGVSLVVRMNLLAIQLLMFSAACYRRGNKKAVCFICALWCAGIGAVCLKIMRFPYMKQRFLSFFSHTGSMDTGQSRVREILSAAPMGRLPAAADPAFGDVASDYVLTGLIQKAGCLPVVLILIVLALFFIKLLDIIRRQKNQLGTWIAFGCTLIFVIQTVEYLLMNFGVLPGMFGTLPFLSAGGHTTLLMYVLAGILLGTYRFKDVVTDYNKVTLVP